MYKKSIKAVMQRYPALASFYRNTRDWFDQQQFPRSTPWGFSFAGHADMADGKFEPDETVLMRKQMTDVDLLVNIGANVGYYCCHALSMGKPVIAVEPNNRNLHYLLKNIQNNGWANLAEVFPVAMGCGTDILQMWGGGTGASLVKGWAAIDEGFVTQVPVMSLDRILGHGLKGKKALILVDIEGAEYMMLQGATKTLISEPRPVWMVEISTTEHQPVGTIINPHFSKTFEMFFSQGYRAFTADEAAIEITLDTVNRVVIGAQLPSTHNFLFKT